jgi:pyridoxamine 5'-phosphate oxidase
VPNHHAPSPQVAPRPFDALRREYSLAGLDEADLRGTWWDQFEAWQGAAIGSGVLAEPTAAVLATDGPTSRTVLVKSHDERGFVFYTNRRSRKGEALARVARAALTLPWYPLERQVNVVGTVEQVADAESDAYFASRPRGAQLGAWASAQSQIVGSRSELEDAVAAVTARFDGGPVPRPPHWGGYLVVPETVEFWQGRPDRLHDRLRFRRDAGAWIIERLCP